MTYPRVAEVLSCTNSDGSFFHDFPVGTTVSVQREDPDGFNCLAMHEYASNFCGGELTAAGHYSQTLEAAHLRFIPE